MIDNHTKTIFSMDKIYFEDPEAWEEDLFDSTEYAMELDRRNPVLEGVENRLRELGEINESVDVSEIIRIMRNKYLQVGITGGLPRTVEEWIKGTPVSLAPAYRYNLYNLCLVLKLNIDETREFFLKCYMTIPFNYKDRIDAIYYFGIKHSLSYEEISELIDFSEELSYETGREVEKTEIVGNYLSEISDVESLKDFLQCHTYGLKEQYNSASNEITRLIEENAKYADCELYDTSATSKAGHTKVKTLLDTIYGYDNQDRYSKKTTKISKCELLPRSFRTNLPNDKEISKIIKKEASPDMYRKALIIMNFYNFFAQCMYGNSKFENKKRVNNVNDFWERDIEDIEADLEDFYYETSKLLAKCGFEQMYARNPFDWLMLYCAKSNDPLSTFRELLAVRFTDVDGHN